jgi:uncharacterized membrane protein YgcG
VQGTYQTDSTSTLAMLTIEPDPTQISSNLNGIDAGNADVILHHIVVHHFPGSGVVAGPLGRLVGFFLTLVSNEWHGADSQALTTIRSSIVGLNQKTGLKVPDAALVTFNDLYGNVMGDLSSTVVGADNQSSPALFLNDLGDFREMGDSPTIDKASPTESFNQEPQPHGDRANEGAYGDTIDAAKTPPQGGGGGGSSGGGGGGGGGCGLIGIDLLATLAFVWLWKRRRKSLR